jgi:uncharacterized protein (TIGR03435 family)
MRAPWVPAYIFGAIAFAQPQAPAPVPFEAASIKVFKPGGAQRFGMEFLPGARFRAVGVPLFAVLATAYNLPWQSVETLRIKGLPDWMLTERYDIEAKAEKALAPPGATAKARNEKIRLMLQSVLAERLRLKMRRETTEMPVWALIVGTHGAHLEKAKIDEHDCTESAPFGGTGCHQFQGGMGRGLHGSAVDMSDLALYVSNWSDRPVVDQTGLQGLFIVKTEGWTSSQDDPSRHTLAEVLEPSGLKLVSKKAAVEILVIEHVDRPSVN